jgi:hypothetical protein
VALMSDFPAHGSEAIPQEMQRLIGTAPSPQQHEAGSSGTPFTARSGRTDKPYPKTSLGAD